MNHKPRINGGTNASVGPPTNRDGIETWLDVLTSMLSLPPSQRSQVRDELEDHLRSRVDDLLIMGQSESEAIRTAITELGETAELARHISNANRTSKSFRRFAMNATFFVLAGSVLTASVSMMMPSNSNTIVPASVETSTVYSESSTDPVRHTFDFENKQAIGVLKGIANAYGLEFTLSDGVRESGSGRGFVMSQVSLKGEYTLQEAIDAMHAKLFMEYGDSTLVRAGTELILMTLDEHKRMQIKILAYPIPAWAESTSEQGIYASTIEQLLSTKHNLEYTNIQPINGSLVVAAPPEVHAEIIDMAAQLQSLGDQIQAKNEQRRAMQREHQARQMERLTREYEQAKVIYFETRRNHGALQAQLQQLELQRQSDLNSRWEKQESYQADRRPDQVLVDQINAEYEPKLSALHGEISEHQFEVDEAELRFERLQQILIDAEADLIFSDLNEPIPVDSMHDRSTSSPVIYIAGPNGVRSGTYQLPEAGKLTLSRFLVSADVQDLNDKVSLQRGSTNTAIGTAGDIISGTVEPIALLPDDQVIITAAD